jgi:D-xylose transport system substrate-binding protein
MYKTTIRKVGILAAAVTVASMSACSSSASTGGSSGGGSASKAKVAFLMPDEGSTRYEEHDHPGFVAQMKKDCPDCSVLYNNANGDATKQQQ